MNTNDWLLSRLNQISLREIREPRVYVSRSNTLYIIEDPGLKALYELRWRLQEQLAVAINREDRFLSVLLTIQINCVTGIFHEGVCNRCLRVPKNKEFVVGTDWKVTIRS